MYIPEIPRFDITFPGLRSEAPGAEQTFPVPHVTAYLNDPNSNTDHPLFAWIAKITCAILDDLSSSSSATFTSPVSSSLGKRSGTAGTNTTIGVVVGLLLTALVIGVGGFLYVYRRSIRFREYQPRRRHRRHRKATSDSSKISDGGGAGAGGDGGGDAAPAPAPAAPAAPEAG
jgi:hypothetical protein